MKRLFSSRLLIMVPGLILAAALILALPEVFVAAEGPGNPGSNYTKLSSGHRGLISLLKSGRRAADLKATALQRPTAPALKTKSSAGAPEARAPQRVYAAPTAGDAALLARSLAQGLREVSPDPEYLPLLDELNRLAARSNKGSASLASAGDELPEPTVRENEPNDSREQAQMISYGDVVAAGSEPDQDLDIFSFEAGAGDYVKIEALPEKGGWVSALLFDSDTNLVSGGGYGLLEDYSPADSRSFAPPVWTGGNVIGASLKSGGTYFIVVRSYRDDILYLRTLEGEMDGSVAKENQAVSYRLVLTNPPTYPVAGRVADDAGHPVAGAGIMVWPHDGTGGANAVSDGDGAFSLVLPGGAYSATVESPAGGRYPTDQVSEQFKVDERGAELNFVLRSGVIFSGRTVDDRDRAVPGLGFSLIAREKSQYRWAVSDEAGAFSVAVFPGTYDIYLYSSGDYPPQPVIRGVEISRDTEYTILVDTGNRVSGRVLDPDGSPVAWVGLSFFGRTDSRYARSDEDGFYQVALLPGTFNITADVPQDVLLPSQEVGTLDVEGDMEFDIRLAAGGVISGTVRDDRGNAVADAGISIYTDKSVFGPEPKPIDPGIMETPDSVETDSYILPRPYPEYYSRWINTDKEGRWQVAVVPGSYVVEVNSPGDYPYQYLQLGVFEVGEGQTVQTPEATLKHGVLFSGRVFLPDGSPMEYGYFQILSGYSEPVERVSRTDILPEPMPVIYPLYSYWVPLDENAEFEIRVLPGTYLLEFDGRAGADGYPCQTTGEVVLERDLEMDFTLDPGILVSGRVLDSGMQGLEGCWLSFLREGDLREVGSAGSERDGSFEVRLVPGDYYLLAQPVKGYFPDSLYQKCSFTGDASLEVVLRQGVRVFGRVTDEGGKPLAGVTVLLVSRDAGDIRPQENGIEDDAAGGEPVFGDALLSGAVLAAAVGLVEEDIPEPVKAGYGDNSESPSSSGGIQADEYRNNNGGYMVPPFPEGVDIDSRLKPEPYWPYWGWDSYAYTDVDGSFEVRVRPGVYDLYAWPSEGGYVSAQLTGLDCTAELEVSLTLEQAEVVVRGEVERPDGGSADSVVVSIYDKLTGSFQVAYTDCAGAFELSLPRGEYELFADGTGKYGRAEAIESLKLDSDRSLRLRLGTGLLDGGDRAAEDPIAGLPRAFSLGANYPNPFNPSTTISYSVAEQSRVTLAVYDLRGRLVKTLVERLVDAGTYSIQWDGKDSRGRQVSSGVYFYRLQAGDYESLRKMVLLK